MDEAEVYEKIRSGTTMAAPFEFRVIKGWVIVVDPWVMVKESMVRNVLSFTSVVNTPVYPSGHFTVAVVMTSSLSRLMVGSRKFSPVVHSTSAWEPPVASESESTCLERQQIR